MNLLKDYLLNSPPAKQPIVPKKSNKKTLNQYEYFNFEYRKRSTSLADMYTAKLNQLPHNQNKERREKSMPHVLTHKQIEAINNYRIEKTIDSLNQYTQQLQLTLVNQYKAHKHQNFRPHKKKTIEPFTSPSQISSYQTINDIITLQTRTKKHPQKTLYETFMNNGLAHKHNEGLELQAVKLPIMDRLDHYNHTKYESQFKGRIYPKEETTKFTHTKIKFHTHKRVNKEISKKSEGEIIPWNTPQEYQFD